MWSLKRQFKRNDVLITNHIFLFNVPNHQKLEEQNPHDTNSPKELYFVDAQHSCMLVWEVKETKLSLNLVHEKKNVER